MKNMERKAGIITNHYRNDWNSIRFKFIFSKIHRSTHEDDEVVTAFRDGQVTLRKNRREEGFTFAELEIGYQGVEPNDLVVHGMDSFAGAIGVSDSRGKASPVLTVLTPIKDDCPRFWAYHLRSLALSGFIQSLAKGIRQRTTDFRWKDIGNLLVNAPDLTTQRAIADFLDRETARIDLLIEKKEKMVDVLGEKKQGMHAAIFNGEIYSNSFIQTNLPFLTRIPEDWEISKFSRYFKIRMGETILSEALLDSGKYAVFSATQGDHYFGYVNETKAPLNSGDIVVPARGNSIGNVKYVTEPSTSTQTTIQVSSISNIIDTRYAYYFMRTFKNSLFEYDRTAIPQITTNQVGRNPIIIPSKLLQEDIVKRASDLDAVIQPIINLVHESVEHLREYRSSLITAAVTGQIDVNNWLQSGAGDRRLDAMQERLPA